MEPVERLEAIEQIRQLKARYFRSIDTKEWSGLPVAFADDAVMAMASDALLGPIAI